MIGVPVVPALDQAGARFQVQLTAVSEGRFKSRKIRRPHARQFPRQRPHPNDARIIVQLFMGKQFVRLQLVGEYLSVGSNGDHVGICKRNLAAHRPGRETRQFEVESRERVDQSPVAQIQNPIWSHVEIVPAQILRTGHSSDCLSILTSATVLSQTPGGSDSPALCRQPQSTAFRADAQPLSARTLDAPGIIAA